jgi:hypothetical protein
VIESDRTAFAVQLAMLSEVFDKELSTAASEAYFGALRRYDIGAVRLAVEQAIRRCQFFPRPAQLIDLLEGGTVEDRAMLAWSRLIAALETYDTGQSVDFGDQAMHAAVLTIGGWGVEGWGRWNDQEEGYARAAFLRAYRAFHNAPQRRVIAYLPGRYEQANALTWPQWTRGLGHEDEVLALGLSGREVLSRRALNPADRRPALTQDGPFAALSEGLVQDGHAATP